MGIFEWYFPSDILLLLMLTMIVNIWHSQCPDTELSTGHSVLVNPCNNPKNQGLPPSPFYRWWHAGIGRLGTAVNGRTRHFKAETILYCSNDTGVGGVWEPEPHFLFAYSCSYMHRNIYLWGTVSGPFSLTLSPPPLLLPFPGHPHRRSAAEWTCLWADPHKMCRYTSLLPQAYSTPAFWPAWYLSGPKCQSVDFHNPPPTF